MHNSPIDPRRIGISYSVKNAVVVPATVPNVEMIEKPIGPQLQIPADAPIMEPSTLPLIFVILFCRVIIL